MVSKIAIDEWKKILHKEDEDLLRKVAMLKKEIDDFLNHIKTSRNEAYPRYIDLLNKSEKMLQSFSIGIKELDFLFRSRLKTDYVMKELKEQDND